MIRFKRNPAGIRQLLRSPATQRVLHAKAQKVLSAAGPDHEIEMSVGRNRARATVRSTTVAASIQDRKTGSLARALQAARR